MKSKSFKYSKMNSMTKGGGAFPFCGKICTELIKKKQNASYEKLKKLRKNEGDK
jgi:hypothetical protein